MSTCRTEVVGPVKADEMRRDANFALQRPISESNVMRLEAEVRAGRFVPGTPIYTAILPDKTPMVLNGQHTLEAIKRSGKNVELMQRGINAKTGEPMSIFDYDPELAPAE